MNTKNIQNVLEHIEIALKAKEIIDSFKPDVVILSDDNALKYVYEPYYYKSKIPFVFVESMVLLQNIVWEIILQEWKKFS